jgi:hypothetical protein
MRRLGGLVWILTALASCKPKNHPDNLVGTWVFSNGSSQELTCGGTTGCHLSDSKPVDARVKVEIAKDSSGFTLKVNGIAGVKCVSSLKIDATVGRFAVVSTKCSKRLEGTRHDETWLSGTITSIDGRTATIELRHQASLKEDGAELQDSVRETDAVPEWQRGTPRRTREIPISVESTTTIEGAISKLSE